MTMPAMVMLDANIYTNRAYKEAVLQLRSLCISSVVIQEIMVIASKEQREALIRDFREKLRLKEAIAPDAEDWIEVGKCFARLFAGESGLGKLSKEELSTLVKDALIARNAIRMQAILITSNTSDFAKIKTVFKSLDFRSPSEFFGIRPR
jgi:predicted nucleic acid-binding protein